MSKKKARSEKEDNGKYSQLMKRFLILCMAILVIIGFGCWLHPLFISICHPWNIIIENAGNIIIAGVILGFISSDRLIKHFYKKELSALVFGEKFIEQRKDIGEIWQKVSIALFKSRFPGINKSLMETIQATYLTSDYANYYEDFEISMKIEWDSADKKFVKVTDTIDYVLVTDTEKKCRFPQRHMVRVRNEDNGEVNSEMVIYVDGKEKKRCIGKTGDDNIQYLECDLQVGGKTRYDILRVINKRYNIEEDSYIGYKAAFLTNNLRVTVDHPSDLNITFIERGTQNGYKKRETNKKGYCIYEYKGLILPRQGYVILLNKK